MEKIVNKIIEEVDRVLNLENVNLLTFNVRTIVQAGLNYMNRKDFPEELILPVADYIIKNNSATTKNIKSVSEGDTRIEYSEVNTELAISNLRIQFNRYRKVGTLYDR